MYTYSDELHSDLHKDVYGCRPGVGERLWWQTLSCDEKQEEWDRLCDRLREQEDAMRVQQQKAVADFESRVEMNITLGAGDRHTAIRWILDSFNPYELDFHGAEVVAYSLGLPYHGSLIDEINCVIDDNREDLLENGDPLERLERAA